MSGDYGALTGAERCMPANEPSVEDSTRWEKEKHEHDMQQHMYILQAAARIHADAKLMASIRTYIREKRDELAILLDDMGGP